MNSSSNFTKLFIKNLKLSIFKLDANEGKFNIPIGIIVYPKKKGR